MARVKAGILVRVSDPLAWADRRGLEVVVTYQFQESAWKGAHQKQPAFFDYQGRSKSVNVQPLFKN